MKSARSDREVGRTVLHLPGVQRANGEYVRSTTDFYSALEADGFIRLRTRTGNMIKGLQIVSTNSLPDEFPDFLS